MSIFEDIQKKQNFSETENQILQYIFTNQSEMEKMTINALATRTYSSNASIIRICHKLGFSGYRDFKIAFVRELENKKLVTNTIDYSYPFQIEESTSVIIQNMYSLFKESMNRMHTELDVRVLEQMVNTIENSERIFMFGLGDTKMTIRSFINKLAKINLFPVLATENGEEDYICQSIDSKDCVIFITYTGEHRVFDRCASSLRCRGIKVLVMTSNQESYIAKNCDCCICVPNLEKKERIATFYSQMVFEYVLNLIFSLLYRDFAKNGGKYRI